MLDRQTLMTAPMIAIACTLLTVPALAGPTLDGVRAKGHVPCGANGGLPASRAPTTRAHGRASTSISAALGDSGKVKFTPPTAKQRFTVLQSGEIDVLSRHSTRRP